MPLKTEKHGTRKRAEGNKEYKPPFVLSEEILSLVAEIAEAVGRLSARGDAAESLELVRTSRIRAIRGSLAIEGNTLSEEQVAAVAGGKKVAAPAREIREARNALKAYERSDKWEPAAEADLMEAHRLLMGGLIDSPGKYRSSFVGVMRGKEIIHLAPPANRVPLHMRRLLGWLASTSLHPLISSSVFHFELALIHPFEDGNGRLARLWQSLALSKWRPILARAPVESMVCAHKTDYFTALNTSSAGGNSSAIIEFMLRMILEAIRASDLRPLPQVGLEHGA
jgi:Fic family protein